MILKLTPFPDSDDQIQRTDPTEPLLVNLDQIAAIHSSKLVRKLPIIGRIDNEVNGSVVTLANGRPFPVWEKPSEIYAMLPYPLTRQPVSPNSGGVI